MTASPQSDRLVLPISTAQDPDFKLPLAVYAFDAEGRPLAVAPVRDAQVTLPLAAHEVLHARLLIAPADDALSQASAEQLERWGAYSPSLVDEAALKRGVLIPADVLRLWPFCWCWVRGRVLRDGDGRAVCGARVHVCEVDRWYLFLNRLPERDVFRLRDDLLAALHEPRPMGRGPGPGPDPGLRHALRFASSDLGVPPPPSPPGPGARGAGAGPVAPGTWTAFNPQPDPPRVAAALNPQPLPPLALELPQAARLALTSRAVAVVRNALVANVDLLRPLWCLWPHWWWRLRCDEVGVLTTDASGRFEMLLPYRCGGDHPDLYFWVEYDFGAGFETVWRRPMACHTHWNYACGSAITIRITDPRVPACGGEGDLPGKQVVVLSIGRELAVRELQTGGAGAGLTRDGQPSCATLGPPVDFSRAALIGSGIPYYRWSMRRLSAPDGSGVVVDPDAVPIGVWRPLTSDVVRHYRVGTAYLADLMGPMPTSGAGAAPAPNLFRIRPVAPPAGDEWVVIDEHVDLATAYFHTASLAGAPTPPTPGQPWPDDLAAGLYELKLELFDSSGTLVDWTAQGIDLRITDQDAPFGMGVTTSSPAPAVNRVLDGVQTKGFRMTLRVDNNRCAAEVLPTAGDLTPDPVCGFHTYTLPAHAGLGFVARHANGFATYGFDVVRGAGSSIPAAGTSGTAGAAGNDGYNLTGAFSYAKNVPVPALVGPCPNAAFSQALGVWAMATNGYGRLSGYDASDHAAFALALPCPVCPPVRQGDPA